MSKNSITSNNNITTDILIIISQIVFYVLLFSIMKSALIDRHGMTKDKETFKANMAQYAAIMFAIYVVICILLIPADSYVYAAYVFGLTLSVISIMVVIDVYKALNGDDVKVEKQIEPAVEKNIIKKNNLFNLTTPKSTTPDNYSF